MKLYGLYIIHNEESKEQLVAGSNSSDKLMSITFTPSNMFKLKSDPNRKNLKWETDEKIYPIYRCYEIPYVI